MNRLLISLEAITSSFAGLANFLLYFLYFSSVGTLTAGLVWLRTACKFWFHFLTMILKVFSFPIYPVSNIYIDSVNKFFLQDIDFTLILKESFFEIFRIIVFDYAKGIISDYIYIVPYQEPAFFLNADPITEFSYMRVNRTIFLVILFCLVSIRIHILFADPYPAYQIKCGSETLH